MGTFSTDLKPIVTAVSLAVMFSLPAAAQTADIDTLFDQLSQAAPDEARRLEREIRGAWENSGSATMDLLLKRGRDAIEAEDFVAAVEHFTALIDHAPDWAEGYYGRAMAHYRLERFGPAMADLQRVLELNPRHFPAMEGVGAIFEQVGRPNAAYEVYSRVLAIHPHYPEVANALERLEREVNGTAL